MTYTITASIHASGDSLVVIGAEADATRASKLMRAFHARRTRNPAGYHLRPSSARKFGLLYDAGFTGVRRQRAGTVYWLFAQQDPTRLRVHTGPSMTLYAAIKIATPQEISL